MKPIIKTILAILFLCCLLKMPYGYYMLVRFVGMFGFAWLAYMDSEKSNKSLMILWIGCAVLIQPIVKIHLGRAVWQWIDIIFAVILLITAVLDILKKNKSE